MTAFGHDTFKQEVLDEIEALISQHRLSPMQAISEVLDVVRYMAEENARAAKRLREEVIQDFLKQYIPSSAIGDNREDPS